MANKNKNLHKANKSKNDEFYTQLSDIEKEVRHYKEHFKDKVVFCNCDDPRVSNFFHYFSYNFEQLGLKKLITTCYKNQNPGLFSEHGSERAVYLEYTGDKDGNNVPDPEEIGIKELKGDGDFRSEESVELLKQADIVVTNPPFSLFREYVMQLASSGKKFLIIGNINAITYKDVFKLIKENKIWLGYNCLRFFTKPDETMFETARSYWYTNLDVAKRHEDIILYKTYNPEEYPTYDNYDAIEVSKTKDIPMDFDGVMGVPITFLDKYNPNQFEIVGTTESNDPDNPYRTRFYNSKQCRDAYLERFGKPGVYDLNASGVVSGVKVFKRVLIRNKKTIK